MKGLSKLGRRRVMRLIDFMEKLPSSADKHFNMSMWVDFSDLSGRCASDLVTRKDLMSCGTTACAGGWASTMPYFRRLGLRLTACGLVFPGYARLTDIFDIPRSLEGSLFHCSQKAAPTPKKWAKRARHLLEMYD